MTALFYCRLAGSYSAIVVLQLGKSLQKNLDTVIKINTINCSR